MKLRRSARTDVGKTRDHNEDNFAVGAGELTERIGELLVICDGMGGHAAGEIASKIGVDTIVSSYYSDLLEDRPHVLEQAFEQANERIYERGNGSMGTTGVAALLYHDALHVANVGDSRAYLIRDGEIRQVSRDHSFVSDQVAAGLITAEQARSSPHRNVITRALGYQAGVTVDLFRLPLQIGDIVLLSSDGMHGLVTDAEIAQIASSAPPETAVQQLIDLANERGGTDNITVVIAQVEELDWQVGEIPSDELEFNSSSVQTDAAPLPLSLDSADIPETVVMVPQAAPAPLPVQPASVERRFSLWGGLLAFVLLIVLVGLIYFAINTPSSLPPLFTPTLATLPTTPVVAPTPALPTPGS